MSTEVSADEIRSYILDHFRDQLDAKGLDDSKLSDPTHHHVLRPRKK